MSPDNSVWFHSINSEQDVHLIYDYVEQMLQAEAYFEPPEGLLARRFDRYLVDEAGS